MLGLTQMTKTRARLQAPDFSLRNKMRNLLSGRIRHPLEERCDAGKDGGIVHATILAQAADRCNSRKYYTANTASLLPVSAAAAAPQLGVFTANLM